MVQVDQFEHKQILHWKDFSVPRRSFSSSGIGESSSPPEPLNVSEEIVEVVDSDISDNSDLIEYPNIPAIPKWAAKTIHLSGELVGNPNDPRRTRSQFESALCVKDPLFIEKCYLMVEFRPTDIWICSTWSNMENSHERRVQLTPEEQHLGAGWSSPREEASSV